MFVFVGTDTNAVLGASNGRGIYCLSLDSSGRASAPRLCFEAHNVSWLGLHPWLPVLYAAHEAQNLADQPGHTDQPGRVTAFAVDPLSGALTPLSSVPSEGTRPAHLSLDPHARFAFVANYSDGVVAVLPVDAEGRLSHSVACFTSPARPTAPHPSTAPPGSFAFSGHDGSHAHMVQTDPSGRWLLHTDLGHDRIYLHALHDNGTLTPAVACPCVQLPDGDGPRHFSFHPNGRWLYSLQEEASTLVLFDFDPIAPSLVPRQTLSSLPPQFAGTSFASEIAISSNGRYLYAANRLHNSIATFAIDQDGLLAQPTFTPTHGDYPNHFSIRPDGTWMLVCNQRSDNLTAFRIDPSTGLPTFTGDYIPIGSPSCALFVDPSTFKR